MTKKSAFLYWLASSNVSYLAAKQLEELFGDIGRVFYDPSLLVRARDVLKPRIIKSLTERADERLINDELKEIFARGMRILTIEDELYPELLLTISSPPLILYCKGDVSILSDRRIAVVGTRSCTRTGFDNTANIAEELSKNGVTVISGMARGIDTAALTGALRGKTPCAAVLGSGADVIYPKENKELYNAIVKNGAVISEFKPGTPPRSGNFPRRNRIISGMCQGVLIAQAPVKSGTAITMRYAADENRDVFAIPGNINEAASALPNMLITEGAVPVTDAFSILNYYGWNGEKKVNFSKIDFSALDFCEQQLYTLLKQGEYGADELVRESGLDISAVSFALTNLEIKGIAERLPGGIYGLKI